MERLTFKNPDGTWGLKNMDIKDVPHELYGAICKLKDYEETGLTPHMMQEIDELYTEKCKELAESKKEVEKEKMLLRDAQKEEYNKGAQEAWDLAKKICLYPEDGGYGKEILIEIFRSSSAVNIMRNLTPQQAIHLIEVYKKKKQKIEVGDIVKLDRMHDFGIVIDIEMEKKSCKIYFPDTQDHFPSIVEIGENEKIERTGKKIDLNEIIWKVIEKN